ncbi:hypothetical protein [Streptomyces spinosisporus]|uniref:Uncharacterized protein n=1 Tax=Streptomyces spinosisporus TaxID=2927582 RepID=A0ABS9XW52_9ACTN|nr:hypothetical protein [Streptomyces spinosisporus]MCI3246299.1 hypothetical protein [Streptomyces spinosisporus]
MSTKYDVPGWPTDTVSYSGALTAQEIAQALKDAGKTVVLREYTDFATTYDTTGTTVTLT